ncbi:hypothetical protein DH09_00470 (plasmid) [Bacillaceae bacterium JMAK1]|nr:hypothetical protein DH09_00470 [Bacillaceae bacterium JMAK1]
MKKYLIAACSTFVAFSSVVGTANAWDPTVLEANSNANSTVDIIEPQVGILLEADQTAFEIFPWEKVETDYSITNIGNLDLEYDLRVSDSDSLHVQTHEVYRKQMTAADKSSASIDGYLAVHESELGYITDENPGDYYPETYAPEEVVEGVFGFEVSQDVTSGREYNIELTVNAKHNYETLSN